jgi:hypothetical protein
MGRREHHEMKLLMENWRKFVNEQEEAAQAAPELAAQLMNLDLTSFIQNIKVKPAQQAILGGLLDNEDDDDKFVVTPGVVTCKNLRPTQDEVVMSKSLEFPLTHPGDFIKYRASNGPFKVGPKGNDAIITFGGKYVIDGHHRWSALYCCNPNAQLHTFDISKAGFDGDSDAANVLKAVQAAILVKLGTIPSNAGGGRNLFEKGESEVKEYIASVIGNNEKLIKIYTQYLKQQGAAQGVNEGDQMRQAMTNAEIYSSSSKTVVDGLTSIIWPNIEVLQSQSRPMAKATEREKMPQTDKVGPVAAGGKIPAALGPIVKGQVNVEKPFKIVKKAAE